MFQSHPSTTNAIVSHQLTKLLNKALKALTQTILKQTHIFDFNLVSFSSKHKVSEGISASVIRQKNEVWKLLFWVPSIGDQQPSLKNMCLFFFLLRLATDTTVYSNSFSLFLLSINVLEQPSNVYKMQSQCSCQSSGVPTAAHIRCSHTVVHIMYHKSLLNHDLSK